MMNLILSHDDLDSHHNLESNKGLVMAGIFWQILFMISVYDDQVKGWYLPSAHIYSD